MFFKEETLYKNTSVIFVSIFIIVIIKKGERNLMGLFITNICDYKFIRYNDDVVNYDEELMILSISYEVFIIL